MSSIVKKITEMMTESMPSISAEWDARSIRSDECVSYVSWNTKTKEAIIVDPKVEDMDSYLEVAKSIPGYLWLGVIDTHTHADHVSCAAELSTRLGAPYVMHEKAPSARVSIRVSGLKSTAFPARAGPLLFIPTPGHTPDSVTVIWGPYIFGGDTVLFGDVGRDDLPGGNPEAHYESLSLIKAVARDDMILLPGHDHKGGRASSWKEQMQINTSLSQTRDVFVREAAAFDAPAPALLKKSLRENFK